MLIEKEYLPERKVLDFDVECRPMAWYGGDFVTKQPTAIAWKFVGGREKPTVAAIGESDRSSRILQEERAMLSAFVEAYNEADVVTGHYIRGFDLILLNGALLRLGMPLLIAKLAQDTKNDLVQVSGVSKSQENLGAMFELDHPKIPMNTSKWFEANLLVPEGIALTKKRVVGDVEQHVELRDKMLELSVLAEPSFWNGAPNGAKLNYHP